MRFLFLILIAVGLSLIFMFNRLVSRRNEVRRAFSGIDVVLRRKHHVMTLLDGALNRVESPVKLALPAELEALAPSRANVVEHGRYSVSLDRELKALVVLAQRQLQEGDSHVLRELLERSECLESELDEAFRSYNNAVTLYNNAVQGAPTSLIAETFGFSEADWYEFSTEKVQP